MKEDGIININTKYGDVFPERLKLCPAEVRLKKGDEIMPWNINLFFSVTGILDYNKLVNCINILKSRHYYLNVSIEKKTDREYYFVYNRDTNIPVIFKEKVSYEEAYEEFTYKEGLEHFDTNKSGLIKFLVYKDSESKFYLGIVISHIIADGISFITLINELLGYYDKMISNESILALNPLSANNFMETYYKEGKIVIDSFDNGLNNDILFKKVDYHESKIIWSKKFLSKEISKKLLKKCKENQVTVFSFLTAAGMLQIIKNLLSTYKEKTDFKIKYATITNIRKWLSPQIPNELLGQWVVDLVNEEMISEKTNLWDLAKKIRLNIISTLTSNYWKDLVFSLTDKIIYDKSDSYKEIFCTSSPICVIDNIGNVNNLFEKEKLKNIRVDDFDLTSISAFFTPERLTSNYFLFTIVYLFDEKLYFNNPFIPWIETEENFENKINCFFEIIEEYLDK